MTAPADSARKVLRVPHGWKRIRHGEIIRKGDMFFYSDKTRLSAKDCAGGELINKDTAYSILIRRIRPRRQAKRKGK